MTRYTTKNTFRVCSSSLLLAGWLLLPAAGIASGPTDPTWRPDPWVTAKIKVLLMTAEDVSAFNVNVDTVDGRVTLHGKVRRGEEKQRAEAIARHVAGVVDVRNLLQVVPVDEVEETAVQDDALRRSVSAAFESDPKLEGSGIKLKSVNQGVVLLSGTADSLMEHLEAIRVASSVDGVRRAATEVQTGDLLYDERLWRDAESAVVKRVAPGDAESATAETEPPEPDTHEEPREIIEDAADGGNPGLTEPEALPDVMTDASVTASIKTRFLEDADIPALSINVDTNDGIVTLFGQAHNEEARKMAEAYARSVPGVVGVRNDIRVVDGKPNTNKVTDDALAREVEGVLEKRKHLERCNIRVSAKDGAIRLDGDVPNRELKQSAATIARTVPGVRSVRNELRVVGD